MAHVLSAVKEAFEQKLFTDLTVECGAEIFKVHRNIVVPQSGFLRKCLSNGFSVRLSIVAILEKSTDDQHQESSSQKICLKDDEPVMVRAMLHHLYGLDYVGLYRSNPSMTKPERKPIFEFGTPSTAQEKSPSEEIEQHVIASLHVKMYILGDKYDIPTLRVAAKQNFKEIVHQHDPILPIIPLIKSIYDGTSAGDGGLRGIIVDVSIRQLHSLRDNPEFDTALRNRPDFSYDMSRAMMQKSTFDDNKFHDVPDDKARESSESSSTKLQHTVATLIRNTITHRCGMCNKSFSSRALVQHDTDSHDFCSDCGKNFRKAHNHRMNVHGGY